MSSYIWKSAVELWLLDELEERLNCIWGDWEPRLPPNIESGLLNRVRFSKSFAHYYHVSPCLLRSESPS